MKKTFLICVLVLLSACGSAPQRSAPQASIADDKMNDVVMYAISLADTPYRYGGATPQNGFDCSGYVGHVFRHTLGVALPRTSVEISRVGDPLDTDQLRPGDLVFYNTQRSAYSHVGIFIGEGKFVHAPKSGRRIRTEKMSEKYWVSRYNGARRIRE